MCPWHVKPKSSVPYTARPHTHGKPVEPTRVEVIVVRSIESSVSALFGVPSVRVTTRVVPMTARSPLAESWSGKLRIMVGLPVAGSIVNSCPPPAE